MQVECESNPMLVAAAATFAIFIVADATPSIQESDALSQDCAMNEDLMLLQLQAKSLSPSRSPDFASQTDSDCQEELRKMDNDQAMSEKANGCLDSQGYNKAVQKALYKGDRKKAMTEAATGFMECANISEVCANEEAEVIIFNVMLAGGAVEEACWQELNGKEAVESKGLQECQDNAMFNLVTKLNRDDFDGALDVAAREHFQGCFGISEQCSVQLAPVLINEIVEKVKQTAIQQGEQQQITEPEPIPSSTMVLLGNLQHASSQHKPILDHVETPEGAVDTIVHHWPEVKAHFSLHKHSG